MVTAAVTLNIVADAGPMLGALDAARIAIEPTPIWDALIAERGPALVLAADDVVEAMAPGAGLFAARTPAELKPRVGGAW